MGIVSIQDDGAVYYAYGTRPGDPRWNPNYDLADNGVISIIDAGIAALCFDSLVFTA